MTLRLVRPDTALPVLPSPPRLPRPLASSPLVQAPVPAPAQVPAQLLLVRPQLERTTWSRSTPRQLRCLQRMLASTPATLPAFRRHKHKPRKQKPRKPAVATRTATAVSTQAATAVVARQPQKLRTKVLMKSGQRRMNGPMVTAKVKARLRVQHHTLPLRPRRTAAAVVSLARMLTPTLEPRAGAMRTTLATKPARRL